MKCNDILTVGNSMVISLSKVSVATWISCSHKKELLLSPHVVFEGGGDVLKGPVVEGKEG